MQDMHKLLSKAAQKLDIPADTVSADSYIVLTGTHDCTIEGHTGIRAYEHHEIIIGLRKGEVCVRGSNLQVRLMHRDQMILTGNITEVCFSGGTDGCGS